MRHPLLDFMLTPMAAPETRGLKRLRLSWMLLCCALGLAVTMNGALVDLLGPKGALPALLLVAAAPTVGIVYFTAKTRADDAHGRADADRGGEP